MRRRPLLATLAACAVGSGAGCLGSLGDDDTPPGDDEPLDGRSQWRYDAGNSGYAAGISGPIEEPDFQRAYEGVGAPPLTANGALYTATWSAEIGGGVRWEIGEPWQTFQGAALYEDLLLGVSSPIDGFWAVSTDDGATQWNLESMGGRLPIAVQGDRAFLSAATGARCIDLAAQEKAWQSDLNPEVPNDEGTMSWRPPAATPSHVFALNVAPYSEAPEILFALDPASGDVDWTVEPGLIPGDGITAGPVVGDGHVFVIADTDETPEPATEYDGGVRVVAVDVAAQDVAWTEVLPGTYGPFHHPAVANGRVYVTHGSSPTDAPLLFSALEIDDGSVAWQVDREFSPFVPTAADETIFACDGPFLRAFDPETGDARWTVNFDQLDVMPDYVDRADPFVPVVHDDRIFVHVGDGRLVEFA